LLLGIDKLQVNPSKFIPFEHLLVCKVDYYDKVLFNRVANANISLLIKVGTR